MLELQVWKGRGCRSLSCWLPSQFLHNNSLFLFPSQHRTHGQSTSLAEPRETDPVSLIPKRG